MLVGKPDGEKSASFYAYIKMMKIYDKNGNMLKELLMEQPTDVTNDESRFAYYSTFPYATDQYIYVLANEWMDGNIYKYGSWEGVPIAALYFRPKCRYFCCFREI